MVFVPDEFEEPVLTDHAEHLFGKAVRIWVGSAPRLLKELADLAPAVGVPLEDGRLSDEVASKINDFAPLYSGDDCAMADDQRTAWLALFEGTRLAIEHQVPLCLAG